MARKQKKVVAGSEEPDSDINSIDNWFDVIREIGVQSEKKQLERQAVAFEKVCEISCLSFDEKITKLRLLHRNGYLWDNEFFLVIDKFCNIEN